MTNYVYVAEYASLGIDIQGVRGAMLPKAPPVAEQKLALSSSSNPSAAFKNTTKFIQVHTDGICSIAIGSSPVAAVTNMRMAANETREFGVEPGQQIAVITNT